MQNIQQGIYVYSPAKPLLLQESTAPLSLVPIANLLMVHSTSSSTFLINILNIKGPEIEPWGTPLKLMPQNLILDLPILPKFLFPPVPSRSQEVHKLMHWVTWCLFERVFFFLLFDRWENAAQTAGTALAQPLGSWWGGSAPMPDSQVTVAASAFQLKCTGRVVPSGRSCGESCNPVNLRPCDRTESKCMECLHVPWELGRE